MIKGSIVALVTPMTQQGDIAWEALERLIAWHLQAGTHSFVIVGTTGESATLNMQEHKQVLAQCVQWVQRRVPVIAGTGANSTTEAIELTRAAAQAGVDACLLVTPYYNKPTQEGLYQHYKLVAEQVDIPQILYNVPGRTACDLLTETVERLLSFPNIIGIKDATGDLARGRELLAFNSTRFSVYSGDDETALELMLMGAGGNISVTANIVPEAMARLCDLAIEAQAEPATHLNEKLMPLHEALFVEPNPIPVKWALYEMGLISEGIRLPLTPLRENLRTQLRTVLQEQGCLQ